MKEFYFQIKGKRAKNDPDRNNGLYGGTWNWVHPPLFSGKVSAENKDEAHLLIEEQYGKKFPRRVAKKDLKSNEFLLHIEELTEKNFYIHRLFEVHTCKQCGNKFMPIDRYNDSRTDYHGSDFCSRKCNDKNRELEQYKRNEIYNNGMGGTYSPTIYKVTNKITKKVYVGKTTQVFTLRWYQHFFQNCGSSKFHEAINSSKSIDWLFEVIEIIIIPDGIEDVDKFVLSRETFWMNHYDSINNGYNSIVSDKEELLKITITTETQNT